MCVDAFRVLGRTMLIKPQVDGDTMVCLFREVLALVRPARYMALLRAHPGRGTEVWELRPYVRVLMQLAASAVLCEKNDVAVWAYEEVLRADHEDHAYARELLLISYLKIIGRARRGEAVHVPRALRHYEALLGAALAEARGPLFGGRDRLCVRWCAVVVAFARGEEWAAAARRLDGVNKKVAKVLLEEMEVKWVAPQGRNDTVFDCRRFAEPLMFALWDWPDFKAALHTLLRGADAEFDAQAATQARMAAEESAEFRADMRATADEYLARGRGCLRAADFDRAITMFTMAKRYFVEALKPSQRWYRGASFAIVSNRATAAEQLGHWWLARHDTRFTLLLRPDHVRSTERLPRIARAFHAEALAAELEALAAAARAGRSAEGWAALAAQAVMLISLAALTHSRLGTLTPALRAQLLAQGVEDMYTPVTVGADVLEPLPWLAPGDAEAV
jgi:hypothetical protein